MRDNERDSLSPRHTPDAPASLATLGIFQEGSAVPSLQTYYNEHWPIGAISEKTERMERDRFRHVLARLGPVQLRSIDTLRVQDLQNHLKRSGLGAYSVNGAVRILRKVLGNAVDRKTIAVLPKWPRPLKEKLLRNELNPAERAAFVAAFDDGRSYAQILRLAGPRGGFKGRGGAAYLVGLFMASKAFFTTALETGLDRGDLIGLRWCDVDLEGGLIRLTRSKTDVVATIPITAPCRQSLLEAAKTRDMSGIVFLTGGKPYSISTVVRYFARAKQLAGINRRFRFKDLRHSYGSNLVEHGVPINVVKECMWHKNLETTLRYSRVTEDSIKRQVLAALNDQIDTSEAG